VATAETITLRHESQERESMVVKEVETARIKVDNLREEVK